MKYFEQKIKGVFIIEPEPFADDRGVFRRHFSSEEFASHGITNKVAHCNVSENRNKHTFRGFHYQVQPHSEGKTLSCFRGAVYDVVIDLRPESATYLKWIGVELDCRNRKSIHCPPGCANGFLTIEDETILHYYCSRAYNKEAERGIRYNDPLFKIKLPHEPDIISEKDKNWPDFTPSGKTG